MDLHHGCISQVVDTHQIVQSVRCVYYYCQLKWLVLVHSSFYHVIYSPETVSYKKRVYSAIAQIYLLSFQQSL